MGIPTDVDARRFYRVAWQRYDDGEQLLKIVRPSASIYLSGYAVECILKALLLSCTPANGRKDILATFRGGRAHDFAWLKKKIVDRIGQFPVSQARHLSLVSSWSTDLRYQPGPGNREDAEAFLSATASVLQWAVQRM